MKPNIIYILFDDLGYGDVSALNEQAGFQTPNFDRLAKEGVAYTDAHATSAVCTPSRYSIITGRYNWRSRLKSSVLGGYSSPLIETHTKTVGEMLNQHGWRTHLVGKWHLGMDLPKRVGFVEEEDFGQSGPIDYRLPIKEGPIQQGFDSFYGIAASLDMPPYVYIEDDRFTSTPTVSTKGEGMGFWREGPTSDDFVHQEVLDHLTDRAITVIKERDEKPFFLFLSLTGPHTPILPRPEFIGSSKTNLYGDFVLHCDDVVGKILDTLAKEGIVDETLVILTSDNGCSPAADFAALKEAGHNPSYIYRGMKSDIYEGGHRIPLIMRWPKVIPPSTRCDRLVSLVDLYATLAEVAGHPLADYEGPDSVSMLSLMSNPLGEEIRSSLVHQSIDGSLAIRKGEWKLEMCPGSGGWSSPRPKSEEEKGLPPAQLYNLDRDIGERVNLIEKEEEVATRLQAELAHIVKSGRSTLGLPLANDGVAIWESIDWLDD